MFPDLPRQVATSPDQYSLSIEQAAARYEHAGHPRTLRTIQRYCAKGHLDCLRQETPFGDKYMITPESVARHIAQIAELASATGRDQSGLVATAVVAENLHEEKVAPPPTGDNLPRQAATDARYVALLESENVFLKTQIVTKDTQITALLDRDHETNSLIQGLQRMLAPLLSGPRRSGDDDLASVPNRG